MIREVGNVCTTPLDERHLKRFEGAWNQFKAAVGDEPRDCYRWRLAFVLLTADADLWSLLEGHVDPPFFVPSWVEGLTTDQEMLLELSGHITAVRRDCQFQ